MADVLRIVTAVLVALLGVYGQKVRKDVKQIHVLVNSNLAEIKRQLAAMTEQRDVLRDQADDHTGQHRGPDG